MEFKWDDGEAESNLINHSVSFDEAQTVFNDLLYVDFYDPDHSEHEDRSDYLLLNSRNKLYRLVHNCLSIS
jgi:uncharacterized protein